MDWVPIEIDDFLYNARAMKQHDLCNPEEAVGLDEHGGTSLLGHDPVVLIPIVMVATRISKDLPQEFRKISGSYTFESVVWSTDLNRAVDGSPFPAVTPRNRATTRAPHQLELVGTAPSHERHNVLPRHWMG